MSQFSVGDVVVLKSGGPKMTVSEVGVDEGQIKCVWFDNMKRETALFNPDTLSNTHSAEVVQKSGRSIGNWVS